MFVKKCFDVCVYSLASNLLKKICVFGILKRGDCKY